MTYTGTQDALHNGVTDAPSCPGLLDFLDAIEAEYGIKFTARPIKQAREAQAKADELRAAMRERIAGANALAARVGTDYTAGKLDAPAVVEQLLLTATLTGDTLTEARRLTEAAAVTAERAGWQELTKVTEDEWLAPIRPTIETLIEEANAAADALGIDTPRPGTPGVRGSDHAWAPTRQALELDLALRHTWERLEDVLDRLDTAHTIVTVLRRSGVVPAVAGRDLSEDYRWLHIDRLNGRPEFVREFWLANRHTATPGVFTAEQMAQADDTAADRLDAVSA